MDQPTIEMAIPDGSVDRDATIRQLITGCDIEVIVVYDESDCQLYGRTHKI